MWVLRNSNQNNFAFTLVGNVCVFQAPWQLQSQRYWQQRYQTQARRLFRSTTVIRRDIEAVTQLMCLVARQPLCVLVPCKHWRD